MLKILTGLVGGALACASVSVFAQTADDCIARFEELRPQFDRAAPGAEVHCVQEGHIISLDAEGALPAFGCDGGDWDHWHLQAKAVLGPAPICSVQLLGLDPDAFEGCGTAEFRMDLPANEGARWRNYLREQCPKTGE